VSYRNALRKTATAGVATNGAHAPSGPVAVATPAGAGSAPQPSPLAEHPAVPERPIRLN
jgi:hypothetical protein